MKRSERKLKDKQKKKLLEEILLMRLNYIVIRPVISLIAEYIRFK